MMIKWTRANNKYYSSRNKINTYINDNNFPFLDMMSRREPTSQHTILIRPEYKTNYYPNVHGKMQIIIFIWCNSNIVQQLQIRAVPACTCRGIKKRTTTFSKGGEEGSENEEYIKVVDYSEEKLFKLLNDTLKIS